MSDFAHDHGAGSERATRSDRACRRACRTRNRSVPSRQRAPVKEAMPGRSRVAAVLTFCARTPAVSLSASSSRSPRCVGCTITRCRSAMDDSNSMSRGIRVSRRPCHEPATMCIRGWHQLSSVTRSMTLILIVSELAANAVQHARTSFSVEVRQESGLAWVCVRDGHPAVPVLRHTSAITAGGRGLALIDAGPAPGGSHPHAYRKAGMGHHRHLLKLTKFGRDPPGAHLSSGCV